MFALLDALGAFLAGGTILITLFSALLNIQGHAYNNNVQVLNNKISEQVSATLQDYLSYTGAGIDVDPATAITTATSSTFSFNGKIIDSESSTHSFTITQGTQDGTTGWWPVQLETYRWWSKVRWFMVLILFAIGILRVTQINQTYPIVIFITTFLGICILNILFYLQIIKTNSLFSSLQIVLDILFATFVVHLTGGLDSSFVWIFLIAVITASLAIENSGGVHLSIILLAEKPSS